MDAFSNHTGIAVPLRRSNIDTDQDTVSAVRTGSVLGLNPGRRNS